MKKALSLILTLLLLLCCLVGCGGGDRYNHEKFYGVVRFSEESNRLLVYIPDIGEVEIPDSESCCSCFDGHGDDGDYGYQLKVGDLVAINFRYEKSWDDNSVRIMESYPARFDRGAYSIEALEENITFDKNDAGYVLSFPSTAETQSAEIGDTLYFVYHGGYDGHSYEKLYASGEITAKEDGIITVALSIRESEAEFLKCYDSMTVELTWGD